MFLEELRVEAFSLAELSAWFQLMIWLAIATDDMLFILIEFLFRVCLLLFLKMFLTSCLDFLFHKFFDDMIKKWLASECFPLFSHSIYEKKISTWIRLAHSFLMWILFNKHFWMAESRPRKTCVAVAICNQATNEYPMKKLCFTVTISFMTQNFSLDSQVLISLNYAYSLWVFFGEDLFEIIHFELKEPKWRGKIASYFKLISCVISLYGERETITIFRY